jgi:hypothetical protein
MWNRPWKYSHCWWSSQVCLRYQALLNRVTVVTVCWHDGLNVSNFVLHVVLLGEHIFSKNCHIFSHVFKKLKKKNIITCNVAEKMCNVVLIITKLSLLAIFMLYLKTKMVSLLSWMSYSAASERSWWKPILSIWVQPTTICRWKCPSRAPH